MPKKLSTSGGAQGVLTFRGRGVKAPLGLRAVSGNIGPLALGGRLAGNVKEPLVGMWGRAKPDPKERVFDDDVTF